MGKQTAQENRTPENTPEATSTPGTEPAAPAAEQPSADEIRAAEKQRIADINAMRQPGVEDLCDEFIANDTPAGDAAIAINKRLAENRRNGQDQLETRRSQGNEIVTDDNSDPNPDADVPVSDEDAFNKKCERDWDKNVGNCRSQFLNLEGFKAYQKHSAKGLVKRLGGDA